VDIKLENRFVSRRHFQVRFESDVFYISDLGSTNGTYLNNNKLPPHEEHVIRDGDRVVLGGKTRTAQVG
jgi:pSer/pThr/pTyr-binding forkhead associated (FHA) protein